MTTTMTRTLTAPFTGPAVFALNLPHGTARVRVGDFPHAEITLSTLDEAASPAGRAVAAAELEVQARQVSVTVPAVEPAGLSGITVTGPGGRIVVSGNVASGMVVCGGDMYLSGRSILVNGRPVATGAQIHHGITAEVRLPRGSALRVCGTSTGVTTTGELEWIDFMSVSGDLNAEECRRLNAQSTSGDIAAELAPHARVRTVSGDIRLAVTDDVTASCTSGDITLADFGGQARLSTVSGDIRVHATEPGEIIASSTSGDVTVTAPAQIADAGAVRVQARSLTGHVRTPHQRTAPSRPRPTRRGTSNQREGGRS